jgi:hypothetical protein
MILWFIRLHFLPLSHRRACLKPLALSSCLLTPVTQSVLRGVPQDLSNWLIDEREPGGSKS